MIKKFLLQSLPEFDAVVFRGLKEKALPLLEVLRQAERQSLLALCNILQARVYNKYLLVA